MTLQSNYLVNVPTKIIRQLSVDDGDPKKYLQQSGNNEDINACIVEMVSRV